MADPQVLGDYDPELVIFTLSGLKSGLELAPSQYAPDSRITVGELPRSETIQGQGGTLVRSRLHDTMTTLEFSLMPSDPEVARLSNLADADEVFTFSVVDNSGVASKVSGKCWFVNKPAWGRNRVAEPVVFSMTAQVKPNAMQHGSTALI